MASSGATPKIIPLIGCERRGAPRISSIHRAALLQADDSSDFCMIRDLSSLGINVETLAALETGQAITIHFNDQVTANGKVIWADGIRIGIRFDEIIDHIRLLSGSHDEADGRSYRSLRLDIKCDGSLKHGDRLIPAKICDISQSGFKAEVMGLDVGDTVVVNLPMFATKRAIVRWSLEGMIGLNFDLPLRYDELAAWTAKIQS